MVVNFYFYFICRQSRREKKKHDLHRKEKQELKMEMKVLSDRINKQVNEVIKLKQTLIRARIWPDPEDRPTSENKFDKSNFYK